MTHTYKLSRHVERLGLMRGVAESLKNGFGDHGLAIAADRKGGSAQRPAVEATAYQTRQRALRLTKRAPLATPAVRTTPSRSRGRGEVVV